MAVIFQVVGYAGIDQFLPTLSGLIVILLGLAATLSWEVLRAMDVPPDEGALRTLNRIVPPLAAVGGVILAIRFAQVLLTR